MLVDTLAQALLLNPVSKARLWKYLPYIFTRCNSPASFGAGPAAGHDSLCGSPAARAAAEFGALLCGLQQEKPSIWMWKGSSPDHKVVCGFLASSPRSAPSADQLWFWAKTSLNAKVLFVPQYALCNTSYYLAPMALLSLNYNRRTRCA